MEEQPREPHRGLESVGDILRRAYPSHPSPPAPITRRVEACTCSGCGNTFKAEVSCRDDSVVWRPRSCIVCIEAKETAARKALEEERALKVLALKRDWREMAGIPWDMRQKTFSNFDKTMRAKVFEPVYRWASEFPIPDPRGYPSLVLYSKVNGVGKTHLAVAAASLILDQWDVPDPDRAVCPVRMESGPGLVARIRATYGHTADKHETEEQVYRELRGVKLLILDDVSDEDPTPHTQDVYLRVTNERKSSGLPLIMTCNKPLEGQGSLEEVLGPTLISRLIGMSQGNYYQLTGKDWRKEHKVP